MRSRRFLLIGVTGLVVIGLAVVIVGVRARHDPSVGETPAANPEWDATGTPSTAAATFAAGISPTTGPSSPQPASPVEPAPPETVVMESIDDAITTTANRPASTSGEAPTTPATTTTTPPVPGTSDGEARAETTTSSPVATLAIATTTVPATTAPSSASCTGTWRAFELVTEQCIIDQATARLTALFTGDHENRMSAIRGGHVLGDMLAGMHASNVERFGSEIADDPRRWESFWIDADTSRWRWVEVRNVEWSGRPYQVSAAWRVHLDTGADTMSSTWWATPLVPVDGEWLISYLAWCRWATASTEGEGLTCPPDPDPGLVLAVDHDGYLSLVSAHHNNAESGTPDYAIGW